MVFAELGHQNKVEYFFADGLDALEFIKATDVYPFLILSDIKLSKLDGFTLKVMVQTNDELSNNATPYLFFSTAANEKAVYNAYTISAQGFFLKPDQYETLLQRLKQLLSTGSFATLQIYLYQRKNIDRFLQERKKGKS